MIVGLHDADATKYPNLALMKLAAWHRANGDTVQKFIALMSYDKVYSSKVFSWSENSPYLPSHTERGGTGNNVNKELPDEIEHICPDYEFYGVDHSLGFLTRGCIRSCGWCIVPEKEGTIRPHADITEFCRHKKVRLMDNNILALPEYAAEQFAKMAKMGLKVDFNQGLDARLIDEGMAKRLAALKWWAPIRLACDNQAQMPHIEKAVRLLREAGAKPVKYSCYMLVTDVEEAEQRALFLKSLGLSPFAQPYREPGTTKLPALELRRFANWVNIPKAFNSCSWKEFSRNPANTAECQP